MKSNVGLAARNSHGFWYTHKFLILRRLSQLSILGLFLLGPIFGLWIIKGNLSNSLILDTIPLTDPFVFIQVLFAGHLPELTAIIGVTIVLLFYFVLGGRTFCSWVCPVNMVTDFAGYLRRLLRINTHTKISKNLRFTLLISCLVAPLIVSIVAWEMINPVSLFHRGIIFGIGYGWLIILTIFIFDLMIVRNGWCGHICPMGAFYGLIGKYGLVNVTANNREACDNCGDCYLVCPEPEILKGPLRNKSGAESPLINKQDCTKCGRCIEVCDLKVFELKWLEDKKQKQH